jgi:hypothetical protein
MCLLRLTARLWMGIGDGCKLGPDLHVLLWQTACCLAPSLHHCHSTHSLNTHLASPQLCTLPLIQRVTSALCVWLAVKVIASYGTWRSLVVTDVSEKPALSIIGSHECGYHSSRFSRNRPGFVGFKDLCPSVTQNSIRKAKFFGGFSSHKNTNFLTMNTKILALPTAVGQSSIGH